MDSSGAGSCGGLVLVHGLVAEQRRYAVCTDRDDWQPVSARCEGDYPAALVCPPRQQTFFPSLLTSVSLPGSLASGGHCPKDHGKGDCDGTGVGGCASPLLPRLGLRLLFFAEQAFGAACVVQCGQGWNCRLYWALELARRRLFAAGWQRTS